jgi:hypothetical protein
MGKELSLMLIVWYQIRGERDAIVIPKGLEHATRYDCQYASGLAAPHYPLPVIPLRVVIRNKTVVIGESVTRFKIWSRRFGTWSPQ